MSTKTEVSNKMRRMARIGVSGTARAFLFFSLSLLLWTHIPGLFGMSSTVITSGSMRPAVEVGQALVYSDFPETVAPSNRWIIIADDGMGGTVAHRFSSINQDGTISLKGDANFDVDSRQYERDDLEGVARFVIPAVGLPTIWIDNGQWHYLLALLGSIALAVFYAPLPDENVKRQKKPLRKAATATGAVVAVSLLVVGMSTSSASLSKNTSTMASFRAAASFVKALYADQVSAGSPSLYWKFNESSGTQAADASGNNRTGVHYLATPGVTSKPPTPGTGTKSVGYFYEDTPCTHQNTNGMTFSSATFEIVYWADPATVSSTNSGLFGVNDASGFNTYGSSFVEAYFEAGTDRLSVRLPNGRVIPTPIRATSSTTQTHLVITVGNGGTVVYENGVQVATDNTAQNFGTDGKYLHVGCVPSVSEAFAPYLTGSIDDVAVYGNKILTPTEVSDRYKSLTGN